MTANTGSSIEHRSETLADRKVAIYGLEIYQITPTTESTSRMDYHIVDPDDSFDEGETNE